MRHCSAVTAVGLKFCSAVTPREAGTGIPAGTGVRLQCPLVECGLKGRYKRDLGQQHLDLVLLTISYERSLFKEAIILNGTSIFTCLPSDESEVL